MISLSSLGGHSSVGPDGGSSVGPAVGSSVTSSVDPAAGPSVGESESGGPKRDGQASRAADGTRFSAVLLALASIGTPLHALPATTGLPGSPRPIPVLGAESMGGELESVAEGSEIATQSSSDHEESTDDASVEVGTEAEALRVGVESGIEHPEALYGLEEIEPLANVEIPARATSVREGEEANDEIMPVRADVLASASPSKVAPDTVTLDRGMLRRMSPEFVSRLERVAERMWNEHGARVEVVEGFRDQSRQDALFAQGRTSQGPVVTWTTESLHTSGVAADVYVDGGPVSAEQALILSRVAGEEGLRTLYPYDSGHLQLDGPGRFSGPDGRGPGRSAPPPTGPSRPASGTARVAPVARVARPARPGGTVMLDTDAVSATPHPDGRGAAHSSDVTTSLRGRSGPDVPALEARAPRGSMSRSSEGARAEISRLESLRSEGLDLKSAPSEGSGSERASAERSASEGGRLSSSSATATAPLPAVDPPRVTTQRQGTPTQEATSLTPSLEPPPFEPTDGPAYRRLHLPIDGVSGASLDIGIRPGTIDAMLNIADPRLAGDLERSLHELRQVLNDRGVDTRGLAVRLVADAPTEASRLQGDGSATRSNGDSPTSGFSSDTRGDRQERFQEPTDERFDEHTDQRFRERTGERSERRDHPTHTRRDKQKEENK
jgi:uncharacterized protein YcbK (DUF882 family)